MKRILAAVLALALLCGNAAALAEGKEKITLEVKTGRFQVYDAEDSYSALFRKVKKTEKKEEEEEEEEEPLPMLLLPLGNNLQLQVSVLPRTVKNRKAVLSVDELSGNGVLIKKGKKGFCRVVLG